MKAKQTEESIQYFPLADRCLVPFMRSRASSRLADLGRQTP